MKSPKLYFLDTGLLCFLLQIHNPRDLHQHAARGSIFESFVLSELYKNYVHRVEAKSTQTMVEELLGGIAFWRNLCKQPQGAAALVYGGNQTFVRNGVAVYPWSAL